MVEAKFKPNIEFKTNDFRMAFMNSCGRSSYGFNTDICMKMEPYKFYLIANYDNNFISKNLFDKSLDNDSTFDELINFLN